MAIHDNDGAHYRITVGELEYDDVKCTVILNDYLNDDTYYPPLDQVVDIVPHYDRMSGRKLGVRVYYRNREQQEK
jgi:hypothetical protein